MPIKQRLIHQSERTNKWAQGRPIRFENKGSKKQFYTAECICGFKHETRESWNIFQCENCGNDIYFGELD